MYARIAQQVLGHHQEHVHHVHDLNAYNVHKILVHVQNAMALLAPTMMHAYLVLFLIVLIVNITMINVNFVMLVKD